VDMPARVLGEPIADRFGLVGGVVVHHQVHVEVAGHGCLDLVEELLELAGTVLGVAVADDRAGSDVESGEQRGRAVPCVVMRSALDLTGAHRQQRLGAIERLDLRFFVNAQHQCSLRGRRVEPDDVPHLLDE